MNERHFADFVLREPVESGGRTITYRAERAGEAPESEPAAGRAPAHVVLLETVKPGLRPTPELRAAFRREAELLERLAHPLFPTLLEAGLADDPPMLVLSDLGGARLDAVLGRVTRLELCPALAIAIELARALALIHRLGLIHGRLRPEQVELGARGTVRLCNLGMARDGDAGDTSGDDELLLLPEDMAPEQLAGESEDARVDVFLLGLLLHRMLTGRKAFARGEAGVGPRPRRAGPPTLPLRAREVPAALGRVLDRCLARRPRDRYADLDSVASHLLGLLRAETSLPSEHLVCRALAQAELGQELPPPADARAGLGRRLLRPPFGKALLAVGAGLGALVLGLVIVRATAPGSSDAGSSVRGVEQRAAELRVLAQPWAEIYVDGELVDVTPIGRPIQVSPGRHEVRFKHPNAVDQVRTVDLIAGQSLWLDVAMPIVRPTPSAAASAQPPAEEAP
jgi:eukaryotic-like serine/threonine-protein kinase